MMSWCGSREMSGWLFLGRVASQRTSKRKLKMAEPTGLDTGVFQPWGRGECGRTGTHRRGNAVGIRQC
jgi:hypothetical protein